MRVLWLDAPKEFLDERRRLGIDGRDEMWDGVLHMVPPAGGPHQRFGARFLMAVGPVVEPRGLLAQYETGLFRSADDYRVPDLIFFRPQHFSDRGAEGAELVLEIRSVGDETYDKLDFYAAVGVAEVLVAHPRECRVELFRAREGKLVPVEPDAEGAVVSDVLGARLQRVDGKIRITWAEGSADI